MNPLTKVKLINELNEREAKLGIKETVSWHSEYKDSAWIFVGGFPYELTEGDIICVFSQYGEVVNINLVRDKKTGKSKGFCFICYEDQRSTILAVDNFNGIKIKGRTIRVDHVKDYKPPKDSDDIDDITKQLREQGCAPKVAAPASSESDGDQYVIPVKKAKKDKKEKKKKKKEKKEKKKALREEREQQSSSSSSTSPPAVKVKQEKEDLAYDKYNQRGAPEDRRTGRGEMDHRKEDDRGQHARRGDQGNGERSREGERAREEERRRDRVGERREGGNGQQREGKRAGREERESLVEHRDGVRESDQLRDRDGDGGKERDGQKPREKDRETAHDRHRERESYSERIRERDGERSRVRESERSRERERGRDKSRERDGERSKDREREINRNRERERERERPGKPREHSRE